MSEGLFHPLFLIKLHAETDHFSRDAFAAYIRLRINYWEKAGPLPAEDRKLAAIARMTPAEWDGVKGDCLELFELRDGKLFHAEMDGMLAEMEKKREAARRAGAASAASRNSRSTDVQRPLNDRSTDVQRSLNGRSTEHAVSSQRPLNKVEVEEEIEVTTLTRARDLSLKLCAAIGVTDDTKTPGLLSLSDPLNWIREGCSLEEDILPTLRTIAARKKRIVSWAYCSQAVFEARDKRLAPSTTSIIPATSTRGAHKPAPEKAHRNHTIIEALARIGENDPNRPR